MSDARTLASAPPASPALTKSSAATLDLAADASAGSSPASEPAVDASTPAAPGTPEAAGFR